MEKLLLFFTCLIAIKTTLALKCYSCESTNSKECLEDSFDASKIATVDCTKASVDTKSEPGCLLRTAKDKKTGVTTTSRKCLKVTGPNDCKAPNPDLEYVNCKVCTADLCNSASKRSMAFVFYAVPLAYIIVQILFGYK